MSKPTTTTFNAKSTTSDVLDGIDLSGKTALVTGASTGLGAETARALARCGAQVTLVARSTDKLTAVAEKIRAETGSEPELASIDLSKPDTIRAFAESWLSRHDTLDILVNNAGILGVPLRRTASGCEFQFATNHLGHFLLTNLLAAPIKAATSARVVNLSSAGHLVTSVDLDDPNFETRDYDPLAAYAQSKTANIWFTTELARRWATDGVQSFAVHPGGIVTELGRDIAPSIVEAMGALMAAAELKSVEQGAATSCWAATSDALADKNGLYLEDCHISEQSTGEADLNKGGYAPHAYDADGAKKLWDLSNKLLETDF